jgi:hypothetical protein
MGGLPFLSEEDTQFVPTQPAPPPPGSGPISGLHHAYPGQGIPDSPPVMVGVDPRFAPYDRANAPSGYTGSRRANDPSRMNYSGTYNLGYGFEQGGQSRTPQATQPINRMGAAINNLRFG